MGFLLDANKNYCSYFKAFVKAHGLKDGDEWEGHKYIKWITTKHTEFKGLIGIDRYNPYTTEQEREFVEFINMG
ncbi:MAG TPA: hypothetical protein VFC41_01540 [Anaerovoracaceae bacterium]|nr:hypothetical protein [Anaerovoracaceae bacterium]